MNYLKQQMTGLNAAVVGASCIVVTATIYYQEWVASRNEEDSNIPW